LGKVKEQRLPTRAYPWYSRVRGADLSQGDLLDECPIFLPPEDLADISLAEDSISEAAFQWMEEHVVVMSQSCDMVEGREKIRTVALCAVLRRSELDSGHPCFHPKGMEDTRRGNLPAFHVLNESALRGLEREIRIVDFRQIYTLPLPFLRRRAAAAGPRLRLLPPYREQLAQSFARFFMRVGLPVDIPPFR
jgi:hypothetical protein